MDMYDTMQDDFMTWDGQYIWLSAKIRLAKKMWFIVENFSKEELHKLWIMWVYEYDGQDWTAEIYLDKYKPWK